MPGDRPRLVKRDIRRSKTARFRGSYLDRHHRQRISPSYPIRIRNSYTRQYSVRL